MILLYLDLFCDLILRIHYIVRHKAMARPSQKMGKPLLLEVITIPELADLILEGDWSLSELGVLRLVSRAFNLNITSILGGFQPQSQRDIGE